MLCIKKMHCYVIINKCNKYQRGTIKDRDSSLKGTQGYI